MTEDRLHSLIAGNSDEIFEGLYGKGEMEKQKKRYLELLDTFSSMYGSGREVSVISVPGRTELSGNHTDHNRGKIIAGSVTLDIIAVASVTGDSRIRLKSAGFDEDRVDLEKDLSPESGRFGKSSALIAGIAEAMLRDGWKAGGFDACTTSDVFKGSGLSSSAAFEMAVCEIFNVLFNDGKIPMLTLCKYAQYAENRFFGKPCGLMDQIACSYGNIVSVDFADKENPAVEQVSFDCIRDKFSLCVINTGGNHADLTADFAEIPGEMKAVAAYFGKEVLRDCDEAEVRANIPALREKLGDRAVLRALHFFDENRRVSAQIDALKAADSEKYLAGVLESGHSSYCYLQNVYSNKNTKEEGLALALYLCEEFARENGTTHAYRLQGGGFAGTVQAYIPHGLVPAFTEKIESVFGRGCIRIISIRPTGAGKVF